MELYSEQSKVFNPDYNMELIVAAQQGSSNAKRELFTTFKPMIKTIAKKKTLAFPQEEEDLFAHLSLEFLLCLEKYDANKTAEFHIYVATKLSYAGYHNYIENRNLQHREQLIMENIPEMPAEDENFEELYRSNVIEDIMSILTPEERILVLARYKKGLTFRQMGEKFGMSHIAIRKRMEKIIAKLQAEISAWHLI